MSVVGSVSSKYYSGFNPLDIGNCALWLDAADSSTLTLSGTNVTQWRDKSGNGAHATPLAGATAGVYTPNSFNSIYPSVFFNVSKYSGTYPTNTGTTLTGFFVGDLSVSATNTSRVISLARSGVSDFSNSTTTAMLTVSTSGTRRYRTERTPLLVDYSTPTINQASIVAVIFDGTNCLFYANGNLIATNASSGSFNISSYAIGSGVQDNAGQLIGNVAEIILYNSAVTTAQRQQIEGYLLWKWGFQATSLAFSPTSISGCALWLDAADTTTFSFSSGSNISQWRDKTSSITFTNFTGTPTLSNGFRNGNAVVSLSGTSSLNNTTLVWPNTNYSVFVVAYQQSSNANYSRLLNGGGGAADVYLFLGTFNTSPNYATFTGNGSSWNDVGSNTPATSILQSWLVLGMTVGGSTLTPYINGIAQNTKTGTTGAFTGLNIGGTYSTNQTQQCFQGFVGEVIVYNSVLSTTQRQQVEKYLMKKWVSPVPITHPYSSIIPLTRAFAPIDIPGCTVWLDAADPATITLSGTNVTQWRDKSGNGVNAFQSTTANQPLYQTNSINGFPSIQFNAISRNNIVCFDTPAFDFGTSARTAFFVIRNNYVSGTAGGSPLWFWPKTGNGTNALSLTGWISAGVQGQAGGASATFNRNQPCLVGYRFGSTSAFEELFSNGTSVATFTKTTGGSSYANATSGYRIGGLDNAEVGNSLYWFDGNIGEIVVFNRALSTYERQQIEGYLARKWGLIGGGMQTISTFNPTNVTGCQLWLDAADSSTLTLSGSSVTQWNDKSGNGRNTSTVYGTPQISTSGFNGLQAVYFGSGAGLTGPITNTGALLTVFVVARLGGSTAGRRVFSLGQAKRSDSALVTDVAALTIGNLATQMGWFRNNANAVVTTIYNTGFIYNLVMNGSTGVIWLNSTSTASTNSSGNFGYSTYGLGVQFDNLGDAVGVYPTLGDGFIAEILVYNSALSTTDRQNIEGYLALKWGLQSSLPSTHPYALRGLPSTHPYVYRMPATTAFNPRQISGCALWLDAADPATISLSGTNVTQWNDKSGNGYNLTQSTDSARPLYDSSANAITFVSNRYLNIPQAAINNANSYALSFVFNPISSSNYIFVKQHDANNTYNVLSMTFATNSAGASTTQSNQFLYWRTSNQGNQATTGVALSLQKQLVTLTFDGTNMTMFVNGSQVSTQASTTFRISNVTNATAFTLGAWLAGTGLVVNNPANFQLHEMIFWNNGLFTSQRQQVEGYLAWKWGLNGGYSPSIAPFTPTSVTGCQLWLDAADSSTFTFSSGSNISQWRDKSGNARHSSQFNTGFATYDGSNRVTITPTGQLFSSIPAGTFSSGVSGFVVFQAYASNAYSALISRTVTFVPAPFDMYTSADVGGSRVLIGNGTAYANGYPTDVSFTNPVRTMYGFMVPASLTWNQSVNGSYSSLTISANPGASYADNGANVVIGSRSDKFTTASVYIYEVILYNSALSTTNRQTIEGYLANKWGLTGSLPSSHPYANRSLPTTHPYKVIQPGFVNSGTFVSTALIFTYAWYGSTNGGSGKNVTSTVQSVYDSGAATITLGNGTFGDPQPGIPKYTWITYTKSGTSYSVGPYGEGTVLTFASL